MYLIFGLIKDPGRPKFDYPEEIKADDESTQSTANYLKMREFMAELVNYSLQNGKGDTHEEWLKSCEKMLRNRFQSSPLQAGWATQLMELHLQWSAPGFQPEKVFDLRQKLITEATVYHEIKRTQDIFAEIPDQTVRTLLLDALLSDEQFNRSDLAYQSSILGISSMIEFRHDPGYDKGEPLEIDSNNPKLRELAGTFNNILKNIFNVRANSFGIKDREGELFEVKLGAIGQKYGSTTLKSFIQVYEALSPHEKTEFINLARRKLAVLKLKYEGNEKKEANPTPATLDLPLKESL